MNAKGISLIKNFSYTLSSNLISLVVSSLVILIIPKLIGIEEYGFWQLYLFYSSYIGFLHLGWIDGIYLRYGGKEYAELDRKMFFSQFLMLLLSQIVLALLIFGVCGLLRENGDRLFIFEMVGIVVVLGNMRCMLLYILQATNRIKNYAKITMMDRIIYVILIVLFLSVGIREYRFMIAADLVGKLISMIYAMYYCKDIVFRNIKTFYFSFDETIENISVGIKLMFANIASILIIGIVRFFIERNWDVATFGKVSLTLSISNMTMIIINAVGVIMFPILRRTDQNKLPRIYVTMRDFLMVILLGLLLMYFPVKVIMTAWLPKYAESLMYMALVFPMFIFEGKMALLINTYLKTLRKEKVMLNINLISMVLSILLTLITTQLLGNLDLAIVSIVILLAFRSVLAEMYLSKVLCISMLRDIILELTLTVVFIASGWFINSWYTVLAYALVYLMYLVIKKNDLKSTIHNIKSLIKAQEVIET